MSEWEQLKAGNYPKELTDNYDIKSIKIGDNEKIFYRKPGSGIHTEERPPIPEPKNKGILVTEGQKPKRK